MSHNLPAQLNSFVGRERAIDDLTALVAGLRLVTLTGAGGCGKTRLALEVGGRVLDEFADGVWLVELAAVDEEPLVPRAVAGAVGVGEESHLPLVDTLVRALEPRHLL